MAFLLARVPHSGGGVGAILVRCAVEVIPPGWAARPAVPARKPHGDHARAAAGLIGLSRSRSGIIDTG